MVKFWHQSQNQLHKYIQHSFEPLHFLCKEVHHLIWWRGQDVPHDSEGICLIHLDKQNGNHVPHTLNISNLWDSNTDAVKNRKQIILALFKFPLKIRVVWQSSFHIFVDFILLLLIFSILHHQVSHQFTYFRFVCSFSPTQFLCVSLDQVAPSVPSN